MLSKKLAKDSKKLFDIKYLAKVARDTGFVKRKSKLTPEIFLAYHVFSGNDLCDESLSALSGRLSSQYDISLSPQGLHERYNDNSVSFLRNVFNAMMLNHSEVLTSNKNMKFNRILINDSTTYALPDDFQDEFKGAGGTHSKSAIKIQLQYDLLSGSFSNYDIQSGVTNDSKYLDAMDKHTKSGDLRLADLGYYKIEYLKNIADKEGFFISKIKSHTNLYKKNPTPKYTKGGKVIKPTEFIKIDTLKLIKSLADDQILELKDIIVGHKKNLKTRLIISKLSEENKEKRRKKHLSEVNRSRGTLNPTSIAWNGVNAYITNIPEDILSATEIHEIYSLRWQIEIMFKIWKSVFEITRVKKLKIQRFKCFLYGRLIALLFSTTIVATCKSVINNNEKSISEIKAYKIVIEFFYNIRRDIFGNHMRLYNLINKIMNAIRRFAIKSKKKGKKTANEILNLLYDSTNKITNTIN